MTQACLDMAAEGKGRASVGATPGPQFLPWLLSPVAARALFALVALPMLAFGRLVWPVDDDSRGISGADSMCGPACATVRSRSRAAPSKKGSQLRKAQ